MKDGLLTTIYGVAGGWERKASGVPTYTLLPVNLARPIPRPGAEKKILQNRSHTCPLFCMTAWQLNCIFEYCIYPVYIACTFHYNPIFFFQIRQSISPNFNKFPIHAYNGQIDSCIAAFSSPPPPPKRTPTKNPIPKASKPKPIFLPPIFSKTPSTCVKIPLPIQGACMWVSECKTPTSLGRKPVFRLPK